MMSNVINHPRKIFVVSFPVSQAIKIITSPEIICWCAQEFWRNVLLYNAINGYKFRYDKNHENRVTFVCSYKEVCGCVSRIHASVKDKIKELFCFKKINSIHTCGARCRDVYNSYMRCDLVKELVLQQVKINPNMKGFDIRV